MEHASISPSPHQANAHVLLVPLPIQGHVAPFMKLGHQLARHGSKVTFLTTEFIRAQIQMAGEEQEDITIISVPDGSALEDNHKDDYQLVQSFLHVLPGHLENLIRKANEAEPDSKITCLIVDLVFTRAPLEIAEKMGLKHAIFFPSAPGALAMMLHIPKLIEAGIIDADDGTAKKNELKIQLSPNLPALDGADFIWNVRPGNKSNFNQKATFQYLLLVNQILKVPNWVLCNWFHELDPSANALLPNIIKVGPLLANGKSIGNFWSEDLSCLPWLDRQSPGSVIYIAFGSSSRFSQQQFHELAFGLELIGKSFLWVVRSDFINGSSNEYPDGFLDRVTNLGKIVKWAPQEKVLAHPSIACYMTHCGWNSTMESISMGIPMLCWPYFGDQFLNKSCVCYSWKVGLEINPDENGLISRYEIKRKADELLCDEGIKANALKLKELAQNNASEGGSSKNFRDFVAQLML
ncbi:unnamed protein product [Dovyalis caffra]|uniref:Glycosyltransferase n=1 Tax=Dovyalis caffra TaxID=77055 RepID=A0AAV1QZJ1_9ROSI|nr:unnamed protein product [Dovyalis caffra]